MYLCDNETIDSVNAVSGASILYIYVVINSLHCASIFGIIEENIFFFSFVQFGLRKLTNRDVFLFEGY